MSDEKLVPMEPIQVTMIGRPRAGTGDGGVPKQQLVETPQGQRNVLVTFVTPIAAILLRFAYAYGTSVLGMVGAGMTTDIIPYNDFSDLIVKSAQLSLAGTVFGSLKDILAVVGKLKDKYPLFDV